MRRCGVASGVRRRYGARSAEARGHPVTEEIALDEEIEATDESIPWRWVLKFAVGFALLLVVVVVASLVVRSQMSSAPSRSPLAELADRAGCAQLRPWESSSAPRESGRCLLGGVTVDLETFPDDDSRDVWVTSHQVIAGFTGGMVCVAEGVRWAATASGDACDQLATTLGGVRLAS